jgi:ADP-ribose pyrophosphatase
MAKTLYHTPFVSFHEVDGWSFVSRKKTLVVEGNLKPDAVVIVGLTGKEGGDRKLVVIRQLRQPIGLKIWELPAGLIDEGETPEEAARREFKEETGLEIVRFTRPTKQSFSSPGLTDESLCICYADVEGTPSTENQEEDEDIEIHFLDYGQVQELADSDEPKGARLAITLEMLIRLGDGDGTL